MDKDNFRYYNFINKVFDIFLIIFMVGVLVVTLYPFLNILAISLNNSIDSMKGGIYIIPREFTLQNYIELFKYPNLPHAFFVSVLRTVLGTLLSIISTCMLAYTLSRKDFAYRKFISIAFIITMYVSGGIIPDFMLMKNLGLLGNFAVYILPLLIGCWNVIVIRSFIEGLPYSLQESAKIDGANDQVIFIKIIMPYVCVYSYYFFIYCCWTGIHD